MSIILEKENLQAKINELENSNLNIYDLVKDINTKIRSLDNNKWRSIEKTKLDESFNHIMDKIDNNLLVYLNECTDLLKYALDSYINTDNSLKNSIKQEGF